MCSRIGAALYAVALVYILQANIDQLTATGAICFGTIFMVIGIVLGEFDKTINRANARKTRRARRAS